MISCICISGICLQMIFCICASICNLPWLPVIAAVEEGSTQPWTAAERLPCNSCARQTSVCTFFAFSLSFCLLLLFSFFLFLAFCLLFPSSNIALQFRPLCKPVLLIQLQNESFPICTVFYYLHKGAIIFAMISTRHKPAHYVKTLPKAQFRNCGFWSNRTLLYFPLSVRPFVCHICFLNAYHLG